MLGKMLEIVGKEVREYKASSILFLCEYIAQTVNNNHNVQDVPPSPSAHRDCGRVARSIRGHSILTLTLR